MSMHALILAVSPLLPGALFAPQGSPAQPWVQQQKLFSADPGPEQFAIDLALWGDTILVGESRDSPPGLLNQGAVHVYVHDGATWSHQAKLTPSDANEKDFGNAAALEGDTALIGTGALVAGVGDAAYVFQRSGSSWSEQVRLQPHDAPPTFIKFGEDVGLAGDFAVIGAPDDAPTGGFPTGSVYVFQRSGTTWSIHSKLFPADASTSLEFGRSVAISGTTILVGDPFDSQFGSVAGAMFVFDLVGGTWVHSARITSPDGQPGNRLGQVLALAGDTAVAGLPLDDLDPGEPGGWAGQGGLGSVYIFERDLGGAGNWGEARRLSRYDAKDTSMFGSAVSLTEDRLLIGASTSRGASARWVFGMAFDPNTGTLYGSDNSEDNLITIDPATGVPTIIGPFAGPMLGSVRGLAFDPGTNRLYGTLDALTDKLIAIDTETASFATIGNLGYFGVGGLAFDASTDTLYASGFQSYGLLSVDTTTGAATIIGPYGPAVPPGRDVEGLAIDPRTGILYGSREGDPPSGTYHLLTIDKATGEATDLGETQVAWVAGLAHVPGTGIVGTRSGGGVNELFEFDPVTALGTEIGPLSNLEPGIGAVFVH